MEITRFMLSEHLTYAIGWTMLHSLWQGMAAALLISLLLRFSKRMTSAHRYLAAYAGLLAVLLLAVGTFAWHYVPGAAPVAEMTDAGAGAALGFDAMNHTAPASFGEQFSARFNACFAFNAFFNLQQNHHPISWKKSLLPAFCWPLFLP